MNEQDYFEQFTGDDPYYDTVWYDNWTLVWGLYGTWQHAWFIDETEAKSELDRLSKHFPDSNLHLLHHHSDEPQTWDNHGTFGLRIMPVWGFYGTDPDKR